MLSWAPGPANRLFRAGCSPRAPPLLNPLPSTEAPTKSKWEQNHLHALERKKKREKTNKQTNQTKQPVQVGLNSLWCFGCGGIKTKLLLDSLAQGQGAACTATELHGFPAGRSFPCCLLLSLPSTNAHPLSFFSEQCSQQS